METAVSTFQEGLQKKLDTSSLRVWNYS